MLKAGCLFTSGKVILLGGIMIGTGINYNGKLLFREDIKDG
jgi:hypothetical protein